MEQRVSLITLGVADVERARAFYEALGWKTRAQPGDDRPAEEWLSRAKRKPFDEVVDRR